MHVFHKMCYHKIADSEQRLLALYDCVTYILSKSGHRSLTVSASDFGPKGWEFDSRSLQQKPSRTSCAVCNS